MTDQSPFSALSAATLDDISAEMKRRGMRFLLLAIPKEFDGPLNYALLKSSSSRFDEIALVDRFVENEVKS